MALSREQQERVNRINQAFAQSQPQQPAKGGLISDIGKGLAVGLSQTPTWVAGAADTVAGLAGADRPFSRGLSAMAEATGISPKAWGEGVRETYSPALQRQQQRYEQDWERAGERWEEGNKLGAIGTVVGGVLTNPRVVPQMVSESLVPSVLAAGVGGRALRALAPKMSPATAGALAQGPLISGYAMSEIDQSVDPRKAALAALGAGAGGVLIAKLGADFSKRIGLLDPETVLAGGLAGATTRAAAPLKLAPRVIGGALSEGVIQEAPQEALERISINWAEDKPLFQGVPRAAVDGLLAGAGMGALFNVVPPPRPTALTGVQPTDLGSTPQTPAETPDLPNLPTPELVQKYQQLSALVPQFTEEQAGYREQAEQERQRIQEVLLERGLTENDLLADDARRTYNNLQQRAAFAEQQGQDSTIQRMRMRIMEDAFGEQLSQPDLSLLQKLRAQQQAENLFRDDGQLKAQPAREFQRLMAMPEPVRNRYLTAQLEIAQADQATGAVPSQFMPIYEMLAEGVERPTTTPPVDAVTETDLTQQGTRFEDSAIAQAERNVDSQREFIRQIDEAYKARAEREQPATREPFEPIPDTAMATELLPIAGELYRQQERARQAKEFEQAQAQVTQRQEVRYEADFDKAMDQVRAQRAQQEITDAEAALAVRDELVRRKSVGTEAEEIISRRREDYYKEHPERKKLAAFRKQLEIMTDGQLEMFRVEELGRAPETRARWKPSEPPVRPSQPTLEGIEKPPQRRGWEPYDPVVIDEVRREVAALRQELFSIEKGGKVYTDPETGEKKRTPWVQPDWYKERPVKSRTADKDYKPVLKRALEGKPLTKAQRELVDYVVEIAQEMRAEYELQDAEVEQAIQEALAERAAVAAEAEAQQVAEPVADDIAFEFGEGIQTAPEGWDVAAEPAPAPVAEPASAPAPVAEPAPAPVAVQETPVGEQQAAPVQTSEQQVAEPAPVAAPEITGAVETQIPGMRVIRKKNGGYFAPGYAKSRATFLNRNYGELGFRYEAVKEGTQGWEVQETRAAPEAVVTPEAVAAPEAVAEPVAPQAAPEAVATPEAVAAPAPPRRRTPIPGITAVEAKQRINALTREADFPNLNHILGSDWGANIAPRGWRDAEHYRVEANRVAELIYGTQPQPEATPDAVQVREAAQVPAQPETQASQEVGEQVRQQTEVQQEEVVPTSQPPTGDFVRQAERIIDVAINSGDLAKFERALLPLMRSAYKGNNKNAYDALNYVREQMGESFPDSVLTYIDGYKGSIPATTEKGALTNIFKDVLDFGLESTVAHRFSHLPKDRRYDYIKEAVENIARDRDAFKTKKAQKEVEAAGDAARRRETAKVKHYEVDKFSDADTDGEGKYFLAEDGSEIIKPVPVPRIKLEVIKFTNKLKVKPKVHIYANQADLKARNPTLYKKAKAARQRIADDFDTTSPIGYSFGDGQIIIFSDRVATEKQLRFILAHETLGHYGFSAYFGKVELHNLLNKVWHEAGENSFLQAAVNDMLETYKGMTRLEAIEEVLADQAARIDTNLIVRIWNALKKVLNALGVRFGDETARFVISQSRKYIRYSGHRLIADADGHYTVTRDKDNPKGYSIDMDSIAQRMRDVESGTDVDMTGKYYQARDTISTINQTLGYSLTHPQFNWSHVFGDMSKNVGHWMKRGLNEIQTMNYTARDNRGYREFFKILAATVHKAFSLRTKYNRMLGTILNPAFEILGLQAGSGPNKTQISTANQMAIDGSLYRFSHLNDPKVIRQHAAPLVVMVDGQLQPNYPVLDKMKQDARITPKMFAKGFSYTKQEAQPISPQLMSQFTADYAAMTEDQRKTPEGRELKQKIDSGSMLVDVQIDVPARPDITEDSIEYKMYSEIQEVMAEAAIDLLIANYAAATGERTNIERIISEQVGRTLDQGDKEFLTWFEDAYTVIREDGSYYTDDGSIAYDPKSLNRGEEFLKTVNQAILGKPQYEYKGAKGGPGDLTKVHNYLATIRKINADAKYDDAYFDTQLRRFRDRDGGLKFRDEQSRFIIQHKVGDLAMFELTKRDAELMAKRTIMGTYVPLGREGQWQVRIQATDLQGREVAISERYRSQLVYLQMDNKGQGERSVDEVNKTFMDASPNKDGVYEMEVFEGGDKVLRPVRLTAKLEVAKQLPAVYSQANLNEVLSTLSRFNIMLKPEERKAVTVGLTEQNAKARTRLKREGTPGYDPDAIKYVSQHLEAISSIIARKQHRHMIDALMDPKNRAALDLWYGSKSEYERLANELEKLSNNPNATEGEIAAAKRNFQEYQHSFVTKNSQQTGGMYHDRAMRDLAFLESQTDVEYTDFASGALGSQLRMWTTFAQLGGSAATAALNIIALSTNVIPFLASYNQKNNFGGGFGPKAASELLRAGSIGKPGQRAFTPFYDKLMEGYNPKDPNSTAPEHVAALKRMEAEGLTYDEALFLRTQIESGVMQAALINAMLGSARGRITSGAAQKAARGWMAMFSHSEQSARRITGLAAYRLARDRALQENKDASDAYLEASKFAVTAINDTLGEYGMFNRPSIFRGGPQQFIFMYKMFPLTSLLLLKNMSRPGQLLMLGMLFTLAGAKGMPLGDDMMDLIDTLAQRLNLGPRGVWKGSSERTMQEFFSTIFGEQLTPYLMRGAVNNIMPVNLSDRVSLSNFVPGTGIGLKGIDTSREWMEIAGPMASFILDTGKLGGNLFQAAGGATPWLPQTKTLSGILRESPVTVGRAVGDAIAYHNTGVITNSRGQVVSEDMTMWTIMGRLAGFYPSAAVRHYDTIRSMSRLDSYQKEVVAEFRSRWVSAKMQGDHETAQYVVQQVREWNAHARGTELEIRNFVPNSFRALQAAKLTAVERYRKSSPIAQRRHIDHIADLFGATD